MTTVEIKAFTSSDLDFVTCLARDEDFAPGVGDIEIYAQTDNQGIWVAWQGSERVGCIAGVTYNPDYAFIGLFVVHPDHRGKGIGRQLWNHALEALEGVTCIGLEAAPTMVDVYERSGFKNDSITTRQQRLCLSEESQHPRSTLLHRNDVEVTPLRDIPLDAIQDYDACHEISPRPHFLECWLHHRAGEVFVAMDSNGQCHGYVRVRPCLLPIGEGWRIGPLLAEDPGIASLLLMHAMDRHKGVTLIDTPGHNKAAGHLTKTKGFRPMTSTVRMYKGSLPEFHDKNVYALACLELG